VKWNQGRTEIDAMLAAGELQRVSPSREHADRLLVQAGQHIGSVRVAAAADPEGAYALAYDAARKALAAVLENQGLRATTRGGHLAVYRAVRAQLDPPLGTVLRPFDRMRRQRNAQEYPSFDTPALTAEDVLEDVIKAERIIDLATRALDEMSPF
jgi:hypothetical protein